jgi:hypothetical protein
MEKLLKFLEIQGIADKLNKGGSNMTFDDDDDIDIYDGEEDDEKRIEAREATLGFKPQKEIVYNQLLPYSESLDEESLHSFAIIKTNLAKTVCLREMRPGFVIWTSRLNK